MAKSRCPDFGEDCADIARTAKGSDTRLKPEGGVKEALI
jgi:hypothetical protein